MSAIGQIFERGERTVRGRSARRILKWSCYAAIAAFCLFRIGTFTPQALDSPGTLRPILYRWFLWFVTLHVHPEQAFSTWSRISFIALMIPPALAVLNYCRRNEALKRWTWALDLLCSRALLLGSIALALFLCRYPILLAGELNPDEGQFLASAHKLFYDSNFFRSVDCGTSGPLNIYPLMAPAVFGFSPDYASSRVIAVILVLLSIFFLYRAFASITTDELARVAILPPIMAFATFRDHELVHYSSEHVPLLLISMAMYGAVLVLRNPEAYRAPMFLLGVIACAAFFTKMQALPIIVAVAAVPVAYVYASGIARARKPALQFLLGLAPLATANALFCLLTGVWPDFVKAYIVTNQRYAGLEGSVLMKAFSSSGEFLGWQPRAVTDVSWFIALMVEIIDIRYFLFTFIALVAAYAYQRTREEPVNEPIAFLRMAGVGAAVVGAAIFVRSLNNGTDYLYILWISILAVPTYLVISHRRGVLGVEPASWFGIISAASLGAALFCIYKAHRAFLHYLLFLILPVCASIGWMVMRQASTFKGTWTGPAPPRRYAFVSLLVVLTLAYGCYLWGSHDDEAFRYIPYTIRPLEGNLIRAMTGPGAQIVVWGWSVRPYLGSGRPPATRDTNMANFFRWPEISLYYRERFLKDLREHPAELFIDAVGPASHVFTDRRFNHFEDFPEIKAYIDAHYVYLADLYDQRYYLRRDLFGRRWLPYMRDPARCEIGSLRCADTVSTKPRNLQPIRMPGNALVEIRFRPTGLEPENATVFSNELRGGSFQGVQLFHVSEDSYRFAFGLGSDWAFSKDMTFKQGEPASLWVELNGAEVTIRRNGDFQEQMHLPRPMADSDGAITLGSWIAGERQFNGEIAFFQISDLEKAFLD